MTTLMELVDMDSLTYWTVALAVAWKSNLDSLDTNSARRLDRRPWQAKQKLASRKRTARVGMKQGFVYTVS